MPSKVKPVPEGYHTVTPILMVDGAAALIEFLERAFGAKVKDRFTDPSGRIAHAEVVIGDSIVQLGDAAGEWKPIQVPLLVYVPDTDAAYEKALRLGATSAREPQDAFYGDRTAGVKDRFGNTWWLATHQEDVSPEEMHRRAEAEWKKGI
jgi:PhnB protein